MGLDPPPPKRKPPLERRGLKATAPVPARKPDPETLGVQPGDRGPAPDSASKVQSAGLRSALQTLAPSDFASAGHLSGPLLSGGPTGVTLSANGQWSAPGFDGEPDKQRAAALSALYRAAAGGVPVFEQLADRRQVLAVKAQLLGIYRQLAVPNRERYSIDDEERLHEHERAAALHLLGELAKQQLALGDRAGAAQTTDELWQLSKEDPNPKLAQFVWEGMILDPELQNLPAVVQMQRLLRPTHPPEEWLADGKLDLVLYVDTSAVRASSLKFWMRTQAGMDPDIAEDVEVKENGPDAEFLYEITLTLPGKDGERIPVTLRIANPDASKWYEHLAEADIVASFGHGAFGRSLRGHLQEMARDNQSKVGIWSFQCWGLASYQEVKAKVPWATYLATADNAKNENHLAAFWTSLVGVARRDSWADISQEISAVMKTLPSQPAYATPADFATLAPFVDRDLDGVSDISPQGDLEDKIYLPVKQYLPTTLPGIDPVDHNAELFELPGAPLRRAVLDLGMLMSNDFVGREHANGWQLDSDLFVSAGYDPTPPDPDKPFRFEISESDGRKRVYVKLNRLFAGANGRLLAKMLALEAGRFLGEQLELDDEQTESLMLAMMLQAFVQQKSSPIGHPLQEPDIELAMLRGRYQLPELDWRAETAKLPGLFRPKSFAAFTMRMKDAGNLGFSTLPPQPAGERLKLRPALELWARFGRVEPYHYSTEDPEQYILTQDLEFLGSLQMAELSPAESFRTDPAVHELRMRKEERVLALARRGDELVLVAQHPLRAGRLTVVGDLPKNLRLDEAGFRPYSSQGAAGPALGIVLPAAFSNRALDHAVRKFDRPATGRDSRHSRLLQGLKLEAVGLFDAGSDEIFRLEPAEDGSATLEVSLNQKYAGLHNGLAAYALTIEVGIYMARTRGQPIDQALAVALSRIRSWRGSLGFRVAIGVMLERYGLTELAAGVPTDARRALEWLQARGVSEVPVPKSVAEDFEVTDPLRGAFDATLPWQGEDEREWQVLERLARSIPSLQGAQVDAYSGTGAEIVVAYRMSGGEQRQLVIERGADGGIARALLTRVPLDDLWDPSTGATRWSSAVSPDYLAHPDIRELRTEVRYSWARAGRAKLFDDPAKNAALASFAIEINSARASGSERVPIASVRPSVGPGTVLSADVLPGMDGVSDRELRAITVARLAVAAAGRMQLEPAERWALVVCMLRFHGLKSERLRLDFVRSAAGLPDGLTAKLLDDTPWKVTGATFRGLVARIEADEAAWSAREPRTFEATTVPGLVHTPAPLLADSPARLQARLEKLPELRGARIIARVQDSQDLILEMADGSVKRLSITVDYSTVVAAVLWPVDSLGPKQLSKLQRFDSLDPTAQLNLQPMPGTWLPDSVSIDVDLGAESVERLAETLRSLAKKSLLAPRANTAAASSESESDADPSAPVALELSLGKGLGRVPVEIRPAGSFAPAPGEERAFRIAWEQGGEVLRARVQANQRLAVSPEFDARLALVVELSLSYADQVAKDPDQGVRLTRRLAGSEIGHFDYFGDPLTALMLRSRYPALAGVPLAFLESADVPESWQETIDGLRAAAPLTKVVAAGEARAVGGSHGRMLTDSSSGPIEAAVERVVLSLETPPLDPLASLRSGRGVVAARPSGEQVLVMIARDMRGYPVGARVLPFGAEDAHNFRLRGLRAKTSHAPVYLNPLGVPKLPPSSDDYSEVDERASPDGVLLMQGLRYAAGNDDARTATFQIQGPRGAEQVLVHQSSRYPSLSYYEVRPAFDFELHVALAKHRGASDTQAGWRALFEATRFRFQSSLSDLLIFCLRYNVPPAVRDRVLRVLGAGAGMMSGPRVNVRPTTFEEFMRDIVVDAKGAPSLVPRAVGTQLGVSGRPKLATTEPRRGSNQRKIHVDRGALESFVASLPGFGEAKIVALYTGSNMYPTSKIDVRTVAPDGTVGWLMIHVDDDGKLDEVYQLLP